MKFSLIFTLVCCIFSVCCAMRSRYPEVNRQNAETLQTARENIREVMTGGEPCVCILRNLFSFNSRRRNQQNTPSADTNTACRNAFALLKPFSPYQIGDCAHAKNPRCMWAGCGRKCYAEFELKYTGGGEKTLVEFAECATRATQGWVGATYERDRPPLNMDDVGH